MIGPHFVIEATDTGYRFGWRGDGDAQIMLMAIEEGGHGEVEKLYGQAERLWNEVGRQAVERIAERGGS